MEEKNNWKYKNDFFITKEEVIVIRTLYLEWGEQEKITRFELPYENIEIDDSENGYHAIDLFDILLHYQFGGKGRRPLDLEFLCYIQFSPEYGIPWQLSTINFVDDMKLDKQKRRLNERFKDTLILLNELDITLYGKPNPNVDKFFERPDDLVYLESLEDYKSLSDNELFNNLRIGLWYKKYGEEKHRGRFSV